MRLLRTLQVVDTAVRHLSTIPDTNLDKSELSSYLARMASITLFADMEQRVKEIVRNRLKIQADQKVSNFLFRTNEGILKRYKRKELADTAELFGSDCKATFLQSMTEQELSRYSNVIRDRHDAAHGDGGDVTLLDVQDALAVAEKILDQFEQAIT